MQQRIFFNNKLHKHLKTCQKIEKKISNKILFVVHVIFFISMIEFNNKTKNYHEFIFRAHRYAIVKKSLILWKIKHDFCFDSDTFMSLINWIFIEKQPLHVIKHRIFLNIKIKEINIKVHDNLEYDCLDLIFKQKCHEEIVVTHVKTKFHFINNFKTKMLIDMNVMSLKQIKLNFENKVMIMSICKNMKISIIFHQKKVFINRIIWTATQIIASIDKIMAVSIWIKKNYFDKSRL